MELERYLISSEFSVTLLLPRKMDENGSRKLHNLEAHLLSESQKDLKIRFNGEKWEEVITEVKKQMGLAGPLVLVSFLQYSLQLISIMFIGHLGELQLSGASMAFSFAGVTGFSLLVYICFFPIFPLALILCCLCFALLSFETSFCWPLNLTLVLHRRVPLVGFTTGSFLLVWSHSSS